MAERIAQIRRTARVFAPYRAHVLVASCCALGVSVLGLAPPLVTANIIDVAIPSHDVFAVLRDAGIMMAATLVAAAISVAAAYLNALVSESVMRDLRTGLTAHMHRLPLAFFLQRGAGELTNRVQGDIESLRASLGAIVGPAVGNVLSIVTALVAMFVLDWRLALVTCAVVTLMMLPLRWTGTVLNQSQSQACELRDKVTTSVYETLSLTGMTLVKSFGRERYERDRIDGIGTELLRCETKLARIGQATNAVMGTMGVLGPAVVWLAGGYLATRGQVQAGVVVAFVALIGMRLYGPAAVLADVYAKAATAGALFARIFEVLDIAPEADDARSERREVTQGEIEFRDVWFSYPRADAVQHAPPTLQAIGFTVRPGEVAALVGPSGSGKTTIANLLLRFYEPDAGGVLIDRRDVRALSVKSLRDAIGIVSQETHLFNDTIAANLRYAKPGATPREIERAIRAARLEPLISALPKGLETVVGDRGLRLSGGERQRLAIARILLKNPRILVLDEATSALDVENETAVHAALSELMRGRTTLIIAHRLSTVANADVIMFVENGRIVEAGKHDQLVGRRGRYYELYSGQSIAQPA